MKTNAELVNYAKQKLTDRTEELRRVEKGEATATAERTAWLKREIEDRRYDLAFMLRISLGERATR